MPRRSVGEQDVDAAAVLLEPWFLIEVVLLLLAGRAIPANADPRGDHAGHHRRGADRRIQHPARGEQTALRDLLTRPKTPRPLHPIQYRPTIRVADRRRIAILATATRLLAQRSGSAAGLRPRARPEMCVGLSVRCDLTLCHTVLESLLWQATLSYLPLRSTYGPARGSRIQSAAPS